jgi:hypothetical protein
MASDFWRRVQELEQQQMEALAEKLERNLQKNLNVWREILEKRDVSSDGLVPGETPEIREEDQENGQVLGVVRWTQQQRLRRVHGRD